MKKLSSLVFLIFILAPYLSLGQNYLLQKEEKPYVEVTGTIEKEIIPDEIYIAIHLSERLEGKEKISIEKQEMDLKNAIQSLGIDLKNLSMKGAVASYQKVKWAKKDVMANSRYLLKVKDAKTVAEVFDKLEVLKITNARISKVDHSKIKEYKKETRIDAIKAAKEKADYLLEAIGEEVGMPLYIREIAPSENSSYRPGNALISNTLSKSRNENSFEDFGLGLSEDLQFEKIIVRSSIYVKFEIKEGKE